MQTFVMSSRHTGEFTIHSPNLIKPPRIQNDMPDDDVEDNMIISLKLFCYLMLDVNNMAFI